MSSTVLKEVTKKSLKDFKWVENYWYKLTYKLGRENKVVEYAIVNYNEDRKMIITRFIDSGKPVIKFTGFTQNTREDFIRLLVLPTEESRLEMTFQVTKEEIYLAEDSRSN